MTQTHPQTAPNCLPSLSFPKPGDVRGFPGRVAQSATGERPGGQSAHPWANTTNRARDKRPFRDHPSRGPALGADSSSGALPGSGTRGSGSIPGPARPRGAPAPGNGHKAAHGKAADRLHCQGLVQQITPDREDLKEKGEGGKDRMMFQLMFLLCFNKTLNTAER